MTFTTIAARCAAQQQGGMFDEPEAPEAFELAAPESSPTIDTATKHGATFEKHGGEWFAIARRRGRAVPLATFAAPTQTEAARMFCNYFHLKA